MGKYDLFYSLGASCFTASNLKKNKIRITSGPFDWLLHCPFDERINFILNDFKNFLNKEDLAYCGDGEENSYYKNTSNGFYYFHDFSKNREIFDDEFKHIKEKYDRRIKRFYDFIRTKKKVLLVWISNSEKLSNETLLQTHKKLVKKFNKEVSLLVIEGDKNYSSNDVNCEKISPYITKYEMMITDYNEKNPELKKQIDNNIDKIFANYTLRFNLKYFVQSKWKKFLVNILCAFIPIKKHRKNLRKRLLK